MRPQVQSSTSVVLLLLFSEKAAVQQPCQHLPREEMFSQTLFSTVPKVCLHAPSRYRCWRQVVVLRMTAQHKLVPVYRHNNVNYQNILDDVLNEMDRCIQQWQAATSLETHLSTTTTNWADWYCIWYFLSDLSMLVLRYLEKSRHLTEPPNQPAQVILSNVDTES